jgi:hypothetical protein
MSDISINKIEKISASCFYIGVFLYVISRALWLYTFCADNPSHSGKLLCDFVYSDLGSNITEIIYWVGIFFIFSGGIVWVLSKRGIIKSEHE